MKSHLYDTVTLPFPLLLLLTQWIIHIEKEKITKDMSKTTTKTSRITNAITHPAVICVLALSLQVTCRCPAATFPLISVFSNTCLQVTTSTLCGSSAHSSSPAHWGNGGSFANVRQEGSLLQWAGKGLCLGARKGNGTRCQSILMSQEANSPASLAVQPALGWPLWKTGVYH